MNQTLEQYLWVYCDYQQDDWAQLLPLAEFVYNNAQNISTRLSPFFADYGYHPRCSLKVVEESTSPPAEDFDQRLGEVHSGLKDNLQAAHKRYKANYDRHVQPGPRYKASEKVWLSRRNIRSGAAVPKVRR